MSHTQEKLPICPTDPPKVKQLRLVARDRDALRNLLYDAIEEIYEARDRCEITAEACYKLILAYSAELNKSYQYDENQKRRREIEAKLDEVLTLIQGGSAPVNKAGKPAIEVAGGTGAHQPNISGA